MKKVTNVVRPDIQESPETRAMFLFVNESAKVNNRIYRSTKKMRGVHSLFILYHSAETNATILGQRRNRRRVVI